MAETSSLLNCRRSNPTASSNLVLSASNGCDSYRSRFLFLCRPQTHLNFGIKNKQKVVFLYNFYYLCTMRKIIAYKGYYQEFMSSLSDNERKKIMRALLLFETEEKMPHHYIKYIRDGLYEFRVTYGNNEFRLFFIFDGEQIVVLFNCFRKKSQKTPKKEINKALKLKGEYYEQKG